MGNLKNDKDKLKMLVELEGYEEKGVSLWLDNIRSTPEAVVNAEREKAAKARDLIAQLEESEAALKKL